MRIKSFLLIFLFLNILFVFRFKNDTKIIEHIKSLIKKPLNSFSKYKAPNKMLCQLCQSTIKPINLLLKNRYAVNITKDIVILVCSIFLEFEECSTLITEFYPLMVDSLIDRILNPRYICSKLAICSNYHYKTLNPDDYARKLLNETKIYKKQTSKESKEIKILQIADLHIDLEYQEVIFYKTQRVQVEIVDTHVAVESLVECRNQIQIEQGNSVLLGLVICLKLL